MKIKIITCRFLLIVFVAVTSLGIYGAGQAPSNSGSGGSGKDEAVQPPRTPNRNKRKRHKGGIEFPPESFLSPDPKKAGGPKPTPQSVKRFRKESKKQGGCAQLLLNLDSNARKINDNARYPKETLKEIIARALGHPVISKGKTSQLKPVILEQDLDDVVDAIQKVNRGEDLGNEETICRILEKDAWRQFVLLSIARDLESLKSVVDKFIEGIQKRDRAHVIPSMRFLGSIGIKTLIENVGREQLLKYLQTVLLNNSFDCRSFRLLPADYVPLMDFAETVREEREEKEEAQRIIVLKDRHVRKPVFEPVAEYAGKKKKSRPRVESEQKRISGGHWPLLQGASSISIFPSYDLQNSTSDSVFFLQDQHEVKSTECKNMHSGVTQVTWKCFNEDSGLDPKVSDLFPQCFVMGDGKEYSDCHFFCNYHASIIKAVDSLVVGKYIEEKDFDEAEKTGIILEHLHSDGCLNGDFCEHSKDECHCPKDEEGHCRIKVCLQIERDPDTQKISKVKSFYPYTKDDRGKNAIFVSLSKFMPSDRLQRLHSSIHSDDVAPAQSSCSGSSTSDQPPQTSNTGEKQ